MIEYLCKVTWTISPVHCSNLPAIFTTWTYLYIISALLCNCSSVFFVFWYLLCYLCHLIYAPTSVLCDIQSVLFIFILCSVFYVCILCSVLVFMCSVLCVLCSVLCVLCSIIIYLCFLFCVLWYVFSALFSVKCVFLLHIYLATKWIRYCIKEWVWVFGKSSGHIMSSIKQ